MARIFSWKRLELRGAVLVGALLAITALPVAEAATPTDPECPGTQAIKAQIHERISYYSFLVDGWSPSGTRREWAEEMFTTDGVLEGFDTSGKKILNLRGRAAIVASVDENGPSRRNSNHFIPNTYFEQVGCHRVVTHSKGFTFAVQQDGSMASQHRTFLYHDEWAQEGGLWRKKFSRVRYVD